MKFTAWLFLLSVAIGASDASTLSLGPIGLVCDLSAEQFQFDMTTPNMFIVKKAGHPYLILYPVPRASDLQTGKVISGGAVVVSELPGHRFAIKGGKIPFYVFPNGPASEDVVKDMRAFVLGLRPTGFIERMKSNRRESTQRESAEPGNDRDRARLEASTPGENLLCALFGKLNNGGRFIFMLTNRQMQLLCRDCFPKKQIKVVDLSAFRKHDWGRHYSYAVHHAAEAIGPGGIAVIMGDYNRTMSNFPPDAVKKISRWMIAQPQCQVPIEPSSKRQE